MNILFVTLTKLSNNTTAGGELYLLDLMRGLAKTQISPYLVFPDSVKPDNLYVRKYNVNGEYQEYEFKGNDGERNFSEIINKYKIDIVHFQHFQTLPLSLIKIARDLNRKLVITIHDYFLWCENFFLLSPLKGKLPSFCSFEEDATFCADCLKKSKGVWELIYQRHWKGDNYSEEYVRKRRRDISQILGIADLIISPTRYVKDSVLNVYPNINPKRFFTVEHGTFKGRYRLDSKPNGNSGKLKVAFLGGFKYEKGSVYFTELLKTMNDPKIMFYIIGSLGSPIRKEDFANLIIIGQYKREELGDVLNREGIDLVVLLSPWAETFSYTLSESIFNGIPVIATDIGAFRERIAKHGVGFLVPYEDPIPRTAQLLKDISAHPEVLEFFKNNCVSAARSLKDIDMMVSDYIELYKKIGQQ